jgi:hypothetical protein
LTALVLAVASGIDPAVFMDAGATKSPKTAVIQFLLPVNIFSLFNLKEVTI